MNGEPVYQVIAGDLRARIASGDLAPGDPMPREVDLARTYHVARMTARQALDLLESEGLIVGERPRRVAHREPLTISLTRDADRLAGGESPARGADAFLGEAAAAGQEPGQEILVVIAQASPDVAARLEIEPGDPVIARQLVRMAGGTRHNMITFWFPDLVANSTPLADPRSIEEGSLAWLEKIYGGLSQVAELTSRMPEPAEAGVLDIPPGVPVIVVWRTSRGIEGAVPGARSLPVVTSQAIYPADRTRLLLSL